MGGLYIADKFQRGWEDSIISEGVEGLYIADEFQRGWEDSIISEGVEGLYC